MKQLAGTLRRRTGVMLGEVDRPTGEVGWMARQRLRDVQAVARNARRALARPMGDWGGCPARPCRAPMRTLVVQAPSIIPRASVTLTVPRWAEWVRVSMVSAPR
jgi:hypothetical protein